jgi:hypothetical protein
MFPHHGSFRSRSSSTGCVPAESVSETVIAAVLLLHERSVDEIVPQLTAAELEHVIKLLGRSPRPLCIQRARRQFAGAVRHRDPQAAVAMDGPDKPRALTTK